LELFLEGHGPLLKRVLEEQASHQNLQSLMKLAHFGGTHQLPERVGAAAAIHAALVKEELKGAQGFSCGWCL
jgi:hypothetical protein